MASLANSGQSKNNDDEVEKLRQMNHLLHERIASQNMRIAHLQEFHKEEIEKLRKEKYTDHVHLHIKKEKENLLEKNRTLLAALQKTLSLTAPLRSLLNDLKRRTYIMCEEHVEGLSQTAYRDGGIYDTERKKMLAHMLEANHYFPLEKYDMVSLVGWDDMNGKLLFDDVREILEKKFQVWSRRPFRKIAKRALTYIQDLRAMRGMPNPDPKYKISGQEEPPADQLELYEKEAFWDEDDGDDDLVFA